MKPRFQFGPPSSPSPADGEIMKRASSIELRLWHDEDRGITGTIEIHCSIGDIFADKYRPQEEQEREQADALRFIRRVLTDFERAKSDDGDDGAAAR